MKISEMVMELSAKIAARDRLAEEITRLESDIYHEAVQKQKIVDEPKRFAGSQFVCGGLVVCLTIGDDVMKTKHVRTYQIGHLPTAE
jgi:hypothetical protein